LPANPEFLSPLGKEGIRLLDFTVRNGPSMPKKIARQYRYFSSNATAIGRGVALCDDYHGTTEKHSPTL